MYFVSLQGHGTSARRWPTPSTSGYPTECTVCTHGSPASIRRYTASPMRVMMPIESTTYGESVISTPSCEMCPPSGPIENGTTYIVRPFIEPSNTSLSSSRISWGSRQLFVGPASSS